MKASVVFGILTLLWSFSADAKTSVWKVEKDGKSAYIGGTVHLLRPTDLPLPEAYEKAYQASDVLVFEVNAEEMAGASITMLRRGMYQDGSTLKDNISASTYAEFEKFCQEHKFPIDAFQAYKPTMVSVNITLGLMMKAGATPEGIDMMFTNRAKKDGKQRLALETVEEQIDALFNDKVNGDEIIKSTIKDAARAEELLDMMVTSLFEGDTETFRREMLVPMKQDTPEFYRSLIEVRNNNWMPKVEAMLETPEQEFILVGGLHLVGDIGLIEQLKSRGYSVTQMD